MKISEIRDLPDEELELQITKAREGLFKFRFHAANEEMQKAGDIRQLRRSIARYKTIQNERRLKTKKEAGNGVS